MSLGIKRTPTDNNDLPHVLKDYAAYYHGGSLSPHSWLANRNEVLAGDCNLSGSRYRPVGVAGGVREVRLADICTITKGVPSSTKTPPGPYPLIVTAEKWLTSNKYQFDGETVCVPLISSSGHGRASLKRIHFASGKFALANLLAGLQAKDEDELSIKFLYLALDNHKDELARLMKGAANVGMHVEDLAEFRIPLPPLSVQKEIVAEIEGYQKVIDGACAVVDHYRPHIPINPNWPMVNFNDVVFFQEGPGIRNWQFTTSGIKLLNVKNIVGDRIDLSNSDKYISEAEFKDKYSHFLVQDGDIIMASSGATYGKNAIFKDPGFPVMVNTSNIRIHPKEPTQILHGYIKIFLDSPLFKAQIDRLITGAAQPNFGPSHLKQIQMPLPALAEQRVIMAEIEAEQALVEVNRDLIARMEKKIQAVLARVWGEDNKGSEA